jgi:hypothetical protein
MKCSTLFAGETAGLLGGLILGAAAMTSVKRFIPARAA